MAGKKEWHCDPTTVLHRGALCRNNTFLMAKIFHGLSLNAP